MHACMHALTRAGLVAFPSRARSRVRAGAGDVRICPRFADRKAMPLQTTIIKNKAELFSVDAGEPFLCDVDVAGFRELRDLLA